MHDLSTLEAAARWKWSTATWMGRQSHTQMAGDNCSALNLMDVNAPMLPHRHAAELLGTQGSIQPTLYR